MVEDRDSSHHFKVQVTTQQEGKVNSVVIDMKSIRTSVLRSAGIKSMKLSMKSSKALEIVQMRKEICNFHLQILKTTFDH